MNAFLKAQFNYCPVTWMFHSRPLSNSRNTRLCERCLRIIYNDKHSNCEKKLSKDNFVSIHLNNILAVTIKMYKVGNGISSEVMSEFF